MPEIAVVRRVRAKIFRKHLRLTQWAELLSGLTSRDEMRRFAKRLGVPIGRSKQNTLENLLASGLVDLGLAVLLNTTIPTCPGCGQIVPDCLGREPLCRERMQLAATMPEC